MPGFHESNKILGSKPIPPAFWTLQLDTIKQYADGVIIWGGWQVNWNENAPWWVATKVFLQGLK
jgi:hypothetical protein